MKRNVFFTLGILFISSLLSSCIFWGPSISGNGNVVKEIREVDEFTSIKTSRGVNVYISQNENERVVVEADENLIDAIETNVENDVLIVTTNKLIRNASALKVHIGVHHIEKISAFAGSNVYSDSTIKSESLDLSSSAGSNIKLDVNTRNLHVSATAGANIYLEGRTGDLNVSAVAGSNVKAEDLISQNCKVKTNSGANVYVTVEKNLDGKASSGANLFYFGNPEQLNISNSSGGNVIKK